jgi:hypothetical protein
MPPTTLRVLLAAMPDRAEGRSCEGWFAWRGGDKLPDGSITMPWCEYGPRFEALWAALHAANALDDTDYMNWNALAEYNEGKRNLAEAPRGDIAKWLLAVYRRERFVGGLWADEMAKGRLKQAIARLVELDGATKQGD